MKKKAPSVHAWAGMEINSVYDLLFPVKWLKCYIILQTWAFFTIRFRFGLLWPRVLVSSHKVSCRREALNLFSLSTNWSPVSGSASSCASDVSPHRSWRTLSVRPRCERVDWAAVFITWLFHLFYDETTPAEKVGRWRRGLCVQPVGG